MSLMCARDRPSREQEIAVKGVARRLVLVCACPMRCRFSVLLLRFTPCCPRLPVRSPQSLSMPPRGASSAKPTAVPKRAAQKNCIREDASLMQKLDAEEATPQAKSKMAGRIRSFDSKISKIIKDNFQGWTSSQVDVLQRDSMTLRQRIARGKGISLSPGSQLGMGKL